MDVVNVMVGESVGRLPSEVPLSNSTLACRIQHMAESLNNHLIDKMEGKNFSLQLDDATDSNRDAHLISYTQFVVGDKNFEDLLFLKELLQVQRFKTCLRYVTLLFVKTT